MCSAFIGASDGRWAVIANHTSELGVPGINAAVSRRPADAYLLVLVVTLIVVLWIPPLRSGLVLDEAGTYWTIKDGIQEAIRRAERYQGQSPLYYAVAWLALTVGGPSEVMLRVPSILAACGATFLLYRVGALLVDGQTGLMAAGVFVGLEVVISAATTARPYALALLFVVGAVLALVRWLRYGRRADAVAYVLFAALTIWTHYLFGVMFLVHAIYVFWPGHRDGPVSRWAFCAALGVTGLLLLPLAPQFLSLTRRADRLSFLAEPTPAELVRRLAPIVIVLGVLLSRYRSRAESAPARSADLALVVTWSFLATVLLFAVSWLTPAKLFLGRYFLATAPGKALIVAWAIQTVRSERVRLAVITGFAALLVIFARLTGANDEWRLASATVRSLRPGPNTPVLVRGGFIEARQIDWLEDTERSSFLLAPLAYYPIDGTVVPLPWQVDASSREYLERLGTRLERHERFILVAATTTPFRRWFARRMSTSGFRAWDAGAFDELSVVVFDRR